MLRSEALALGWVQYEENAVEVVRWTREEDEEKSIALEDAAMIEL